eukprot:TRINITY_DN5022_c1_g1_i2.p1 TRINITY_DN5022_c1_g1~~TRINITY_DN5022_c1_g1_i2.p1  ORF type:complete len:212 (-),score=49.31 TRINITY_DN5022_c1_g1_i2:179-814(-)
MEGIADEAVFGHMDKLLGANLKSATLTAHIAAHHLEDDGLLVLTGAKAALQPTGWAIAYGMTKAATHHLIKSVAADAKFTATVAGILPITIDTPQNRKSMPDADFSTYVFTCSPFSGLYHYDQALSPSLSPSLSLPLSAYVTPSPHCLYTTAAGHNHLTLLPMSVAGPASKLLHLGPFGKLRPPLARQSSLLSVSNGARWYPGKYLCPWVY